MLSFTAAGKVRPAVPKGFYTLCCYVSDSGFKSCRFVILIEWIAKLWELCDVFYSFKAIFWTNWPKIILSLQVVLC